MSFTSLLPAPIVDALSSLQLRFGEARGSLIRIRADRVRLARTGWRPRPPSETKLIRSANWEAEPFQESEKTKAVIDFDFESRFVPTAPRFSEAGERIAYAASAGRTTRVFLRGLELDEPRFSIAGRPIGAALFDLAFALSRNPQASIVLPRVDGYLEARFWGEVGRAFEGALALPRHSIRFWVALETIGGLVEAEEILFELKESVIGLLFDARLNHFDDFLMDSGNPSLPHEDVARNPWEDEKTRARIKELENLSLRRKVALELTPEGAHSPLVSDETFILSLEELRKKAGFSFHFLRSWFGGEASPGGRDWRDFELARATLWTAIRSGFLREENYDAWREEFGSQPFQGGTVEDAAVRTLDLLLRTAVFPESAKPLAFAILLEHEKTRSVESLRLA